MQPEQYILLVDDDEICHYLSRRALKNLPFTGRMIEACDGIEACDHIRSSGPPLFVLLDLRMPRMDGEQFLEVLDSGQLGEPPPVFIVTSSARPDDVQLLEQFSFVRHYFEKPFKKTVLSVIRNGL